MFGLGNKESYPERYNVVGRAFEQRLCELGAQLIHPRGEGNAGGSIEQDFEQWKEQLFQSFSASDSNETTPVSEEAKREEEATSSSYRRKYQIDLLQEVGGQQQQQQVRPHIRTFQPDKAIDARNPIYTRVSKVVDLCPSAVRAKKELELDICATPVKYRSGDHIGVFAKNDPNVIQQLAERLAIHDLNARFSIESVDGSALPFIASKDDPLTIGQVLEEYVDLNAPPRPSTIRLLSELASKPEEKEILREMSSTCSVSRVVFLFLFFFLF